MKKRPVLSLTMWAVLAVGMQTMAVAKEAPFFSINSPDHPRSWYVGNDFDQLDQSLTWDHHAGMLALQITYTLNGNWPPNDDPDLSNSFIVHFPAVHLDPVSREIYFIPSKRQRINIGSLQSGFFGPRVILDRNVSVNASRRNGVINAALMIYPSARALSKN